MSRQGASDGFAPGPAQQRMRMTNMSYREPKSAINMNKREEDVFKKTQENERLKSMHLEKLLNRAIKELKRYQDRFGHALERNQQDDDSLEEQNQNVHLRKQFNFDTLEPLLLSYEDYIQELQKLISMYSREVTDLEMKAAKFVEENQALRRELEKKCLNILNIYKNGDPNDTVANVHTRIVQENLKEQIKEIQEQNISLNVQYKELNGKVREKEAERLNIEEKLKITNTKLEKLQEEFIQLTKTNASIESRHKILEEENQKLMQKLTKATTLAAQNQQENIKLEIEVKTQRQRGQQLQKELDENMRKFKQQISTLEQEKKKLEQKNIDSESNYNQIESELQNTQNELNDINKQHQEKLDQLEQALKTNADIERKLKQSTIKEEISIKSQTQIQEQYSQAILEKDKIQVELQQLKTTLQNLERKQEEEIQDLRNSTDTQVKNIRSKARAIIDEKDDIIDNLTLKTSTQEQDLDRMFKESKINKQQIQELETRLKNEKLRNDQQINYLKKQISEVKDELEQKERTYEDRQNGLNLNYQSLEITIRNQQQIINDFKKAQEQLRKQHNLLENQNIELRDKLNRAYRERHSQSPIKDIIGHSFSK